MVKVPGQRLVNMRLRPKMEDRRKGLRGSTTVLRGFKQVKNQKSLSNIFFLVSLVVLYLYASWELPF